jgi:translation initiation factor 2B subunit (eIF-2B alpha/beta/delta family)
MALSLHLPQISPEDAVRFLHSQGLQAGAIYQRLVDLFEDNAMEYSAVTHTIRQLSRTDPETPRGRPTNFSVDAAIRKVLNGDPTVSLREIAQEAKLSI